MYRPHARLHFADERPAIETKVEILDNGWVWLLEEDELHPPNVVHKVEDITQENSDDTADD